ncbi:unnamed protein product [Ostreobium quekettii]|uniref:Uncharacterized protein n=1 Tax=Ostreobium quekettii TaxID=121088 RepID=A0A8S1JFH1_9CHLO|nr:unnamed protein product [Ostreobium quekettii]
MEQSTPQQCFDLAVGLAKELAPQMARVAQEHLIHKGKPVAEIMQIIHDEPVLGGLSLKHFREDVMAKLVNRECCDTAASGAPWPDDVLAILATTPQTTRHVPALQTIEEVVNRRRRCASRSGCPPMLTSPSPRDKTLRIMAAVGRISKALASARAANTRKLREALQATTSGYFVLGF